MRVREAAGTESDILAVCCPYEVYRYEDATKSISNSDLKVRDIIELLDYSMGGDSPSPV